MCCSSYKKIHRASNYLGTVQVQQDTYHTAVIIRIKILAQAEFLVWKKAHSTLTN